MTSSLVVRNPIPLMPGKGPTGNGQSLALGIESDDAAPLYLRIPLGDGDGALMTQEAFLTAYKNTKISLEKITPQNKADISLASAEVEPSGTFGRITVRKNRAALLAKFAIAIQDFSVGKTGKVTVSLAGMVGDTETELATTEITVAGASPRILSFSSTHYQARSGTPVTLSWQIDGTTATTGYRLKGLSGGTVITQAFGAGSATGAKKIMAGTGNPDEFQLEALDGDLVKDTRRLTVHTNEQTILRNYFGPGDNDHLGLKQAEILGVYNRGGSVYAVVRDQDPTKGASIWKGQDWLKVNPAEGKESWKPLTVKNANHEEEAVLIPAEAATRPGVIFEDRLYFMGGSSYEVNERGKSVGYLSFEMNVWVDDPADDHRWPADMPARMGHSLLASPDGSRLWVIGGHDGGSALNDVWVYQKGAGWKQHSETNPVPWASRCLAGAAFLGRTLWIAGGFDNPGGDPSYDDIWYLDSQTGGQWTQAQSPLRVKRGIVEQQQFRGCALAASGDNIYVFSSYFDVVGGGGEPHHEIGKLEHSGGSWSVTPLGIGSVDWIAGSSVDADVYYRLDATTVGNILCIRRLAEAELKDKVLHMLILY